MKYFILAGLVLALGIVTIGKIASSQDLDPMSTERLIRVLQSCEKADGQIRIWTNFRDEPVSASCRIPVKG